MEPQVITIDSIFGGESVFTHFSGGGQFRGSYAIDPDQPVTDSGGESYRASGLIRPTSTQTIESSVTINGAPLHLLPNPKNDDVYIYDSVGSVYSLDPNNYALTAVGDLNDGGDASGNGGDYYDNHIYFGRDTTVARYGPLSGSASFTDNFWAGTLSKAALENTTYPTHTNSNVPYPNHPLHLHSNGRLYIGDVVDNQGFLHYIATTKTTVEGDTDDSSTEQALDMPYGYWPMDIETYGDDLAVSLYQGSNDTDTLQKRARIAFWDATASSPTKNIEVEFPDPIITALQNVNGVLYTFSGQLGALGTRVCRFIGGYTFEQVAFVADSMPPFPGATDALLNKVLFGGSASQVTEDNKKPCVWGIGSKTGAFTGVFNVMGSANSTSSAEITSMKVIDGNDGLAFQVPVIGVTDGTTHTIERQTNDYGRIEQIFESEVYRIGRPFKVVTIRIPLGQPVASGMIVTPEIVVDNQNVTFTGGSENGLAVINNTNYSGQSHVVMRPESLTGEFNFFLRLTFSGTALCVVGLPIIIEYVPVGDN